MRRRYTTFWPSLAEPSRKIMHVPISHATLQCSATPSASMHPRPNPSSLSMAASRHCLGALSKGMRRGNKRGEVKKGSKIKKDSEFHAERQGDRGGVQETGQDALSKKVWCMADCRRPLPYCFCNISLLLCGTTYCSLLENGVEAEFCF